MPKTPLPSRDDADALALMLEHAGMFDDAMHDASLIVRRFASGRLVDREAFTKDVLREALGAAGIYPYDMGKVFATVNAAIGEA